MRGAAPTMDDGKVKITVSYEDENGEVSTVEKEMTLFVTEEIPMDYGDMDVGNMTDVEADQGFFASHRTGVLLAAAAAAAAATTGGLELFHIFAHIAADAGAAVRGDGAGAQLGKVEIVDAAAFALVEHLAHQRVFLHGTRLLGVFLFFAAHGAAHVAADLLRHGRALVYGAIGRTGVVVGVGLHLLVFAGISGAGIGQRVLRSVRFRGDARLRGCIGNAFKAARADDLPAGADLDARLQRFSTFGAKHWVPSLPPHISMAYLLYLT